MRRSGLEEQAAGGLGVREEDEDFVGPVPPAPATPPQDCDSLDIDVGLDSASTGIQPMSVSGPGDCPPLCQCHFGQCLKISPPHHQNCAMYLAHASQPSSEGRRSGAMSKFMQGNTLKPLRPDVINLSRQIDSEYEFDCSGSPVRACEEDEEADIEEDAPEDGSLAQLNSRRGAAWHRSLGC